MSKKVIKKGFYKVKRNKVIENKCPIKIEFEKNNKTIKDIKVENSFVDQEKSKGVAFEKALKKLLKCNDFEASLSLLHLAMLSLPKNLSEIDTLNYNVILQFLHSLKPKDEIEVMLISQMLALHAQGLSLIGNVKNSTNLNQINSYSNASTKLLRLFQETLKTLLSYRNKGQQKIIVENVNVNSGGKAIVGNLQKEGGGKDEN